METAFICSAQGMLRVCLGFGSGIFSFTCCLSEMGACRMKAVAESNGLTAFDTTLTCREWAKAGGVIESA